MLTPERIKNIKSTIVALGLVDKGEIEPKQILGTGFFVSKTGYVMSAAHVLKRCVKFLELYERRKEKTELAAFHLDPKISMFEFNTIPIGQAQFSNLSDQGIGYTGPQDLDLGIAVPATVKRDDFPYLEIKPSAFKPALASEIAICGYPKGAHTMNLGNTVVGVRVSPVVQYGRISGFMLYDDAELPYGVQTDIVGTSGSSGSPIVDISDGKVVGIAQEVIPTEVEAEKLVSEVSAEKITDPSKYVGMARIGLVYGVTNQVLFGMPERAMFCIANKIPMKFEFRITYVDSIEKKKPEQK